MVRTDAGMLSLAVSFPPLVRLNGYWEEKYPEMVLSARERSLSGVWNPGPDAPRDPFTLSMLPFLKDPFRGTIARRFLAPGQTALDLEEDSAIQALKAAGLAPRDIDLTLVASFLPDQIGVGNAAFLAQRMGLSGNAWNIETGSNGALAALETACAFVKSGQAERVLVVISCTYSRGLKETDALIWSVGDGAAAFVVGKVGNNEGLLAVQGFHTGETCGAMSYEFELDQSGAPVPRVRDSEKGGQIVRETAERYVLECCERVLEKANLRLGDIDFFVTATPMAWYSRFTSSVLGFEPHQTIDTHALYANTGPVLVPTNLHAAVATGRIRRGDVVLLYAAGSASSRAAAVVRWGEVRVGQLPGEGVLELAA